MENKQKTLQELMSSLEQIAETQQGTLVGGFATVGGETSRPITEPMDTNVVSCPTNNCHGGNCVSGCGG